MFSICLIAKNEADTLANLVATLPAGVEIILVDTGSADGTQDLARDHGIRVVEVGARFMDEIDAPMAARLNREFVVEGEDPIVTPDRRVFNFSAARNFAASLASHDMIVMPDCDEVYTAFDPEWIEAQVAAGVTHIYNDYVWSRDERGQPTHSFMRDRIYDRRAARWVGITHENLRGDSEIRRDAPADKIAQDHRPPKRPFKSDDLPSLALDTHSHPDDRRLHYFARELMYRDRPRSAIRQLERHVREGGWLAEVSQSLIYMGDCYGRVGETDRQAECYGQAFHHDPTRRTALLRLAQWHKARDHYAATAAFAAAALEVPYQNFYADDQAMYRDEPHALIYWARGWQGDIAGAREHLLECLKWKPLDATYLSHTKYYFEYADAGIDGWMTFPELTWLYNAAKRVDSIAEVGSWKGRSTHALLSGCRGAVTAIDTWPDSEIHEEFRTNLKSFDRLVPMRMTSEDAAKLFPDRSFDLVFIDGSHDYASIRKDISAWRSKARSMICGHDYAPFWPGVVKAVDEVFGKPDGVVGSIWYSAVRSS
jgi:glycosyltransferase involved in cell wall biosynthesis